MQSPQHDTAVLGIMYTVAYLGFQLGEWRWIFIKFSDDTF